MCGIAGLFLKDPRLESELGSMLKDMMIALSDRGPDSAGFAIYSSAKEGTVKITVRVCSTEPILEALKKKIKEITGIAAQIETRQTHLIIYTQHNYVQAIIDTLKSMNFDIDITSIGSSIEIYKEVGLPEEVCELFDLESMQGTHAIGHTRMATESAVTTMGAHPFSTGPDQCLVHNGSLSNHNHLRRELARAGVPFFTMNDTEVAAAFISKKLQEGMSLDDALKQALIRIDGFFNFVVGTESGFGVVRDAFGCKPAAMAETDQYVAFASEYQALTSLPAIASAHVWEPDPAQVYFWEHETPQTVVSAHG